MDNCRACQIILCLRLWVVDLLPHNCTVISDAPDAVEGYELNLIHPFYLHPALLQADDFVTPDSGPVARSAPIDKFHLGSAKIEIWIMSQTQEKGVTGSHCLIIPLCICPLHLLSVIWVNYALQSCKCPLSHSPGSILQVGMRQPPLITAHFAAYIDKHTIFAPGLG